MTEWKTVPLGDLIKGAPRTGVRQEEGEVAASTPFISTGLVSAGLPILAQPPEEFTAIDPKDRTVRRGDLLLVSRGVNFEKPTRCSKVEFDECAAYSESLVRLRIKPEIADPDYVRLFLTSRLGRLSLGAIATGSVITNLPYRSLVRAQIRVPDLNHQREIVTVMRDIEQAEIDLETLISTVSRTRDALQEALIRDLLQPTSAKVGQ